MRCHNHRAAATLSRPSAPPSASLPSPQATSVGKKINSMPNAMAAIAHAHRGQAAVIPEPPKVCNWWTVPDYHWVGVLRTAPGCTRHTNHWACDGLCTQPGATGMEGDDSKDVIRERKYGCWFYTMFNASSSSAAYVNVGRSLRAVTRCGVGFLLGLHLSLIHI